MITVHLPDGKAMIYENASLCEADPRGNFKILEKVGSGASATVKTIAIIGRYQFVAIELKDKKD